MQRSRWRALPTETRGLLLMLATIFTLLSLISFRMNHEELNWLGLVGYRLSLGLLYLLGWGAYSLAACSAWIAWHQLKGDVRAASSMRVGAIIAGTLSLCGLLNLWSELWPTAAAQLSSYTWSHQLILRGKVLIERVALGGEPMYMLMRDIPHANLLRILSPVGCAIVFSMGLITTILILGDTHLVDATVSMMSWCGRLITKCWQWLASTVAALWDSTTRRSRPIPERANLALYKTAERPAKVKPEPQIVTSSILPEPKAPPQIEIAATLAKKAAAIQAQRAYNGEFEHYRLPPPSLLKPPQPADAPQLKQELSKAAQVLEETLGSFGIEARVGKIHCGPTIAQFEVHPAVGVKIQRIKAVEDDLTLNLKARSLRLLTPIPGKGAVGVEIPSPVPQSVSFSEILASIQQGARRPEIPMMLGKTVTGEAVIGDLARMPHCIIAGATGSGKSVCLNAIIASILMTSRPDEIRMLMVDPKKVELTHYSDLPHMLAPVITDATEARSALFWLVKEMEHRYEVLRRLQLRNVHSFNQRKIDAEAEAAISQQLGREVPHRYPYYVGIVDELADLMMVANSDIETPIARIAQMARAVGIHLILATQRPSREVITGLIKANFPTRIAFKVASRINSQIILDDVGAENLLGNGDMLYLPPGHAQLVRAQGCYLSDEEISKIIAYACEQAPARYVIKDFSDFNVEASSGGFGGKTAAAENSDPLFTQARTLVIETGAASTTFLQRKLKIGYARAASLMDQLEEAGVVGPADGAKPRKVLRGGMDD